MDGQHSQGLWLFTHNIWTTCCTTLHDIDRAETLHNTQQQLNNQITELFTNFLPNNYQQEDHHLFTSQTLQQRLLMAKNDKYMATLSAKLPLGTNNPNRLKCRIQWTHGYMMHNIVYLQIMVCFHSFHGLLHP